MANVSLVAIDRDGSPMGFTGVLSEVAHEVFGATVSLYESVGFKEPWIGYLALDDSVPVGTCGFKSAPVDGRVEIAYFVFPEFEGKGIATGMATELVVIARQGEPLVVVAAQTLPERNASTRVLEKLGFRLIGTVDHPEDGNVWEWQLAPETALNPPLPGEN